MYLLPFDLMSRSFTHHFFKSYKYLAPFRPYMTVLVNFCVNNEMCNSVLRIYSFETDIFCLHLSAHCSFRYCVIR